VYARNTKKRKVYCGALCCRHRWTVADSLYCTHRGTFSQCSSSCRRWLSPRSYFRVSLTTPAAAFSTRWSLSVVDLDPPPSENGAAVVASCPRLQRAPRRDESIVQGVTRVSGGGACSVHHYLARELFSPAADRKLHGPCNCSDKRLPVRHLSSNSYASRTGIELTI